MGQQWTASASPTQHSMRLEVAPSNLHGRLTAVLSYVDHESHRQHCSGGLQWTGSSVLPHSGAVALGDLLSCIPCRPINEWPCISWLLTQLASDTALLPAGKSANSMLPQPDVDAELEGVVDELREGSVEARSAAAEKLFNMCAEDEGARQRTGSLGVVQPLVRFVSLWWPCCATRGASPADDALM